MSHYYDIRGNAITVDEWTTSRKDGDWETAHRKTDVDGHASVSTVWLGMDHRYGDDGPPLIFESMIFGGNLDQTRERYSTMEEAHAGHERLVAQVRAERDAFADLAADPRVRDAVAVVQAALAGHRGAFGLYESDGGDLFADLADLPPVASEPVAVEPS